MTYRWIAISLLVLTASFATADEPVVIKRLLPPAGIEIDPQQRSDLSEEAARLHVRCDKLAKHLLIPDAEMLVKSVELALLHNEFYRPNDVKLAMSQLAMADARLSAIENGKSPWQEESGLVVRGYRSPIDGSAQPYGLEIPADLNREKPCPLYIWLHGRGDKQTDLHFIEQRRARKGQISPQGAIVVHPFGRQCIGFKSAGEIDVLDVVAHVQSQYNIDPQRIVLMGFSMGGAGCWHIGAHYADRWVAMSPGAGFAETALYNRLKAEDFPPSYEQTLWGLYDVPAYTRNLFNLPVIAYSGEMDRQIQAARVMEDAFQSHDQELTHLIGPGMGHRYHPDTLKEILRRIGKHVEVGLTAPKKVSLQTRTLRYPRMHWVTALGLQQHWQDSRIDAVVQVNGGVLIQTENITALELADCPTPVTGPITIDGQEVKATIKQGASLVLENLDGKWQVRPTGLAGGVLRKRPGLQGPIDDVFYSPFLVVTPTGKSQHPEFSAWVEFELQHLRARWKALFRGELPEKRDVDVSDEDIATRNLILWGDAESNTLLAKINDQLPIPYGESSLIVGDEEYARSEHAAAMIFPNPLNPDQYVVINSGPTFRENHDRTNSLQNPKLPDWAIINFTTPPSGDAPGKVVAADFFDESWSLKAE